jgi:type I restriction enzyme S subunit
MVRPIQRHFGFLRNTKPNTVVSTGFVVLTSKETIDPYFLYSLLTQDEITEYLDVVAEGSTSAYPAFTPDVLENLPIYLPPLPEQRTIAGVLSSFDDKIDLLHRQNKTLEGMAEALWRKMFVEDADPKWKKGKLGEIAYFLNGKARPEEVPDGPIPIYGCNGILGYTNRSNFNGESIIIGRVGAYCGSLYIENRPIWISDNALLAKPIKIDCSKYIFYLLKNQDLNSMAEGSSHPLLTQTLLSAIEIDIVPEKEMLLFGLNANMWLAKIDFNDNEIHALCLLRDTLLPKLMSGELKVNV